MSDSRRASDAAAAGRFGFRVFETKVARRVLLLFLLCAALPLAVFAGLGYLQVRRQLTEQSWERLGTAAKNVGMSVLERLELAENELGAVGEGPSEGSTRLIAPSTFPIEALDRPGSRWLDALDPRQREALRDGRSVVHVVSARPPNVMLLTSSSVPGQVAWSLLDPDYLSSIDAAGPAGTSMCVLVHGVPVHGCTHDESALSLTRDVASAVQRASWEPADGRRLGARREVFLAGEFASPSWDVWVSEPQALALASLSSFTRTLVLVMVLCSLLVAMVSDLQLNRILDPVARLKDGTLRVAEGDLESRVEVGTGDEFEDLANSFNHMVQTLSRQFGALSTAHEIDHAILGAKKIESVVEAVLRRAPSVVGAETMSVTVLEEDGGWRYGLAGGRMERVHLKTDRDVLDRLDRPAMHRRAVPAWGPVSESTLEAGELPHLEVPIALGGRPHGALRFTDPSGRGFDADAREHATRIASHVAVALSNAQLLKNLDELNVGTIRALASAIDAKSQWTAGHSERVTSVAVDIGRAMGLDEQALETLERGSILHDVGKIGVPASILEKEGPLDEAEWVVMRAHTEYGVRIVEKISQYAPLLPIIGQHHERWNGAGYPDGLVGEEIDPLARIVAVADAFDAITSDRPYRCGLPRARALQILGEERGTGLEAEVVDVWLELCRSDASAHVIAATA